MIQVPSLSIVPVLLNRGAERQRGRGRVRVREAKQAPSRSSNGKPSISTCRHRRGRPISGLEFPSTQFHMMADPFSLPTFASLPPILLCRPTAADAGSPPSQRLLFLLFTHRALHRRDDKCLVFLLFCVLPGASPSASANAQASPGALVSTLPDARLRTSGMWAGDGTKFISRWGKKRKGRGCAVLFIGSPCLPTPRGLGPQVAPPPSLKCIRGKRRADYITHANASTGSTASRAR